MFGIVIQFYQAWSEVFVHILVVSGQIFPGSTVH